MDIMLERILELVGNKHGSSQELVRAIGATKNAVTEWKSGRSKSYKKYALQIAQFYDVSLDWLTGLSNQKEKRPIVSNETLIKNAATTAITGMVPILGEIPAGYPVLANEEILGYAPVAVHNPQDCFLLLVKGDSMINAGIQSGDMVLIRRQPCAEEGQIVACRVNGDEATLKRFHEQDNSVMLVPENPKYSPILISKNDFESGYASIIGVAIQVTRNL